MPPSASVFLDPAFIDREFNINGAVLPSCTQVPLSLLNAIRFCLISTHYQQIEFSATLTKGKGQPAPVKTHTTARRAALRKAKGSDLFQPSGKQTNCTCFFSTENIYLQEMKSITYLATYMFRLQKQVVCSLVESSRQFKKEKQQFLSTQWTCLQCEQSGGTTSR